MRNLAVVAAVVRAGGSQLRTAVNARQTTLHARKRDTLFDALFAVLATQLGRRVRLRAVTWSILAAGSRQSLRLENEKQRTCNGVAPERFSSNTQRLRRNVPL